MNSLFSVNRTIVVKKIHRINFEEGINEIFRHSRAFAPILGHLQEFYWAELYITWLEYLFYSSTQNYSSGIMYYNNCIRTRSILKMVQSSSLLPILLFLGLSKIYVNWLKYLFCIGAFDVIATI